MTAKSTETSIYSIPTEQKKLTREQGEAVGLLSIGTFLEYFDLMLYVHMAVLLNELFFPKYDPHTTALLSAAAFCSTYVLRPFGALIFGYIGDNVGRKVTVVITTALMSLSCLVMATLPTYAEIGIKAAWLVTICRVVQGMTSMGEKVGAELYLTEYLLPPKRHMSVALMSLAASAGASAALALAVFVTSYNLNWRYAFWFGAGVAVVGFVARTTLRETRDFADAKRRLQNNLSKFKNVRYTDQLVIDKVNAKVSHKTTLSLLFIDCIWPVMFYFVYVHCAGILKSSFNYTAEQIIENNLIVSLVMIANISLVVYLSNRVHPLKILIVKFFISFTTVIAAPILLNYARNGTDILIIQSLILFCAIDSAPANGVFFKYFPVFKRFTYTGVIYAVSRALVYVITSIGLVYLTEYLGNWGSLIITVPTLVAFWYGLSYFIAQEKIEGNFLANKKIPAGFEASV